MARHLLDDKTIKSTLRVPDQEIRAYWLAQKAKTAKPERPKPGRLSDGDSLYLATCVGGVSHCWRFDYRFQGKRLTLSLGVYPRVGLADARNAAEEARKSLDKGIDLGATRKAQKAALFDAIEAQRKAEAGEPPLGSFEEIARRWSKDIHAVACSAGHVERTLLRLEQFVFPYIGSRAIATIEPPEVLECIRRIERRGTIETAQRTHAACGQVFRFAIGEGSCKRDPSADLKDALKPVIKGKHAAITKPAKLRELLLAMEGYKGTPIVRTALHFSPLVFQRPGEIRHMQWAHLDLDEESWTIPPELMKRMKEGKANGPSHLVPLSRQAVDLLREIQPITGSGTFVFPGARTKDRPMSENTVCAALKSLGYDGNVMTAHGFRATARTILAEVLNETEKVIDAQLAHAVTDPNGDFYNRTEWVERRREMMQVWADYLDDLRTGRRSEKEARSRFEIYKGQLREKPNWAQSRLGPETAKPAHQRSAE